LAACGLVGYPNVGKSTVFNALAGASLAEAANYPFCTIDPNICKVPVRDHTLDQLARLQGSKRTIYDQIEIRDIAGLIKGASKGEGMGNAFLSHIRGGTQVIIQVVRCFENGQVPPNPVREFHDIQEELIIADMEFVSKRLKAMRNPPADLLNLAERVLENLEKGNRAKPLTDKSDSSPEISKFVSQLITAKPLLVLATADAESQTTGLREEISRFSETVNFEWMSAAVEAEAAAMVGAGEAAFAAEWLPDPRVHRLTGACREALGLDIFYTLGPEESRSWLFRRGAKIPEAGGAIHSDFDKMFSRAEVVKVSEFLKRGVHASKTVKGRDYVVPDAEDVIEFKLRK